MQWVSAIKIRDYFLVRSFFFLLVGWDPTVYRVWPRRGADLAPRKIRVFCARCVVLSVYIGRVSHSAFHNICKIPRSFDTAENGSKWVSLKVFLMETCEKCIFYSSQSFDLLRANGAMREQRCEKSRFKFAKLPVRTGHPKNKSPHASRSGAGACFPYRKLQYKCSDFGWILILTCQNRNLYVFLLGQNDDQLLIG